VVIKTETKLSLKDRIKCHLPRGLLLFLRLFRTSDGAAVTSFLADRRVGLSMMDRCKLILRFYRISLNVHCEHAEAELFLIASATLKLPPAVAGCIVEAGCFKGGSTAKLSTLARIAGRKLVTFDSFEGIPENTEHHGKNIWGGLVAFGKGDYMGELREVQENVRRFGDIECCRFIKGFFEDTLPHFDEPVAAAYIDVDLASSTRSCLKYLWPLLTPGGIIFSQDGHLPLVLKVLADTDFWNKELGCVSPEVVGMGKQQLVWFVKQPSSLPYA
jgi:O-methyltransferase